MLFYRGYQVLWDDSSGLSRELVRWRQPFLVTLTTQPLLLDLGLSVPTSHGPTIVRSFKLGALFLPVVGYASPTRNNPLMGHIRIIFMDRCGQRVFK